MSTQRNGVSPRGASGGMRRVRAGLALFLAGLCTLDVRCPDAQLLLLGAWAALDEARALGPGRVVASADEESGLRWLATPPPSP